MSSAPEVGSGGARAGAAARSSTPAGPGPVSLMLLRLGQRWFAVDARSIEEVALRGPVTRVPLAPSHLLGVTSLRGRLVTVVSLEQMVGGSGMLPVEHTATLPRLVVVRGGDCEMAVVAHGIHGLLDQTAVTLRAPAPDAPAFVAQEFDWNGVGVALLDAGRLVDAAARLAGMRGPGAGDLP
jgi:purine-binding chemotaxis protein CheW